MNSPAAEEGGESLSIGVSIPGGRNNIGSTSANYGKMMTDGNAATEKLISEGNDAGATEDNGLSVESTPENGIT